MYSRIPWELDTDPLGSANTPWEPPDYVIFILRQGITKCSNEVYNKLTNIHQHNKYLLEYIGSFFI